MRLIQNLPNLLTLFNLFLGCMGIVYMFNDHMVIMTGKQEFFIDMGLIHLTCYCVMLAGVVDFFDGFVARALKVESALGKQLDSLADVVTFGVVPGLIMYELLARAYYANYDAFDYPILYFSAGFLLTLFAAVRLAKFNIDSRQSTGFLGLPSPAMAMIIVSLPLLIIRDEMGMAETLSNRWILLGLTAVLCWLMVSEIPMLSLKLTSFAWDKNQWVYGLLLISIVIIFAGIFVFNILFAVIPIVLIVYILISITKNITEHGI